MPRVDEILRYLRESLWFIPGILAISSLVVAGLLVLVDTHLGETGQEIPFIYAGSVDGAREVLSTIAMSMLTFTGLVFSITMLVLQAASSQLSPRVLRTFLRDRSNQVVLGMFVATFLFALVVLRYTRSDGDNGEGGLVPGLSIAASFVLLVASIGAFIYYIDHMAHAIRASTVIHNIAAETRTVLEDLFPDPVGEAEEGDEAEKLGAADDGSDRQAALPDGEATHHVRASKSGVLVAVDEKRLLKAVGRQDGETQERFVEMVPLIGDYVPEGSTIFRVWGDWDEDELKGLQGSIEIGQERTLDKDAGAGIRQLVDIALRALSPGINDPTTAVQAIDRIHDILYRIAQRRIPSPLRRDPTGKAILYLRRPGWSDYVLLSVEEIRLTAESQVHVLRRMRQMLLSLLEVAPIERRPPIEAAIERIDRSAARGLDDELDRRVARATDAHGQGPMTT
ncbi:MAG TPA: DUF2254 domain-containing protein [Candidatus Limnocylindrales bacterium]|nr:DUF2254 domain-containing protein [Candidatus Limnocylindrales bacterium]